MKNESTEEELPNNLLDFSSLIEKQMNVLSEPK